MRARGPGRVNLIGEHTDYNDGLCLPFAVEAGVTVTSAAASADGEIEAHALEFGEEDRFDDAATRRRPSGWRGLRARHGRGAERRRASTSRGARLASRATCREGAGLSSSAALGSALCLALLAVAGRQPSPSRRELARLCSRVENDWVGAQTGLLDQMAALLRRARAMPSCSTAAT